MGLAHSITEESLGISWERVKEGLRAEFGEATFRSWLKAMEFAGVRNGQIMLTVPTRFIREWIIAHYADVLRRLWCREYPALKSVDIFVRPAKAEPVVTPLHDSDMHHIERAANEQVIVETPERDAFSPLDPRYTFDSFVTARSNELAFAAARRVAESSTVVAGSNPLYIYGGVGLGKTHLMHAIAWHIRKANPGRKVMYLSAEKFMYQFVKALRQKDIVAFKDQFRSVDVLMIDDIQFISGKDSTQEEFYHTFNALVDQNHQLVISGDRAPSELERIEERVRSRLGWGLVVDIQPTSFDLRMGILQAKLSQTKTDVPAKVLEFLAQKITSNVRELEGALNRVVAHATLVGRPVTIENAQEVLQDLLRVSDRKVMIEDIQKKVAEHFGIKVSDMNSVRRSRNIARPRQVAMFLAKRLTTKSLPEIGRKFGGKDHTTVIHAVRKIEEICTSDRSFAEEVELLSRLLQN